MPAPGFWPPGSSSIASLVSIILTTRFAGTVGSVSFTTIVPFEGSVPTLVAVTRYLAQSPSCGRFIQLGVFTEKLEGSATDLIAHPGPEAPADAAEMLAPSEMAKAATSPNVT
jgi:hypothetical protein